jgi:hypothetical protein
MTPGDLYRTCRISAYRLETLQHYEVPNDAERQAAFHAGRLLPPPRRQKVEDLQLISELRAAGRDVGRVHLVTKPLSDYVRYELAVYGENVAAGEEVRIADKAATELAGVDGDFAIFDGGTPHASVILFNYDGAGKLLGYDHVAEPQVVHDCWVTYRLARRLAEPLDTFLANCA